jgi:hypothetical protein
MNGILVATNSGSVNLNSQNLEQCLKTIDKLGSTVYVNICNGTVNTVPFGGLDWALVIFLVVGGLLGILFLLALVFAIFNT